jgi:hypothetical protein
MANRYITENATRLSLVAVLLVLGACRRDGVITDPNKIPRAVAKVSEIAGQPADQFMMSGGAIVVPFDGSPVEVRLDGRESSDADGTIEEYRWFSATPGPGGTGRFVPDGEESDWPENTARPTVTLDERRWSFTLWVVDNEGAVSNPSTITLVVGEPPDPMMGGDEDAGSVPVEPVDPAVVAECVGTVFDGVADPCKECICSLDDGCRTAVAETECNEACWALISCVGRNCPDYAEMAAANDFSCLVANCMPELTAGQTGAAAAGACARMCPDACRSM